MTLNELKNIIREVINENNKTIIYTAIFFDTNEVVSKYKQVHPNLYSHHSTIEFKPKDISNLPIGEEFKIRVIGRLTNDKVDVLIIENQLSKNKYPHITLSTAEGIKPFQSNSEIENNLDKIIPANETLTGIIGYFDGSEITKLQEEKKADRCLRIARRKNPQTSAYRSGLIVQCRKGKIWKGLNEEESEKIDDKYFNGMLITNDILKGDKPIWQPLYEFLKSIFGEKYEQAADGYMFYGSYIIEDFNDLEVFQYRHGITRKYFYLDSEGQPYKIDFSYSNFKKDNYVSGVKKIPYQEQFKLIYSDLIKYIESACKTNDCVVPDDYYLMKYSDYKILRDKTLNKFGYNVQTIKSKKDIEDFGKELNEKTDFSKEKSKGLHGWFERRGGSGKSKGWVDCNTCRKDPETGRKKCKTCGRQEGEKRAKYPACRPTPSDCSSKGKGKSWGKKSAN